MLKDRQNINTMFIEHQFHLFWQPRWWFSFPHPAIGPPKPVLGESCHATNISVILLVLTILWLPTFITPQNATEEKLNFMNTEYAPCLTPSNTLLTKSNAWDRRGGDRYIMWSCRGWFIKGMGYLHSKNKHDQMNTTLLFNFKWRNLLPDPGTKLVFHIRRLRNVCCIF